MIFEFEDADREWPLAFLGYHYGANAAEIRRERTIAGVVERLGDLDLVRRTHEYYWDEPGGYDHSEEVSVRGVAEMLVHSDAFGPDRLDAIKSLDNLILAVDDFYSLSDGVVLVSLMTREGDEAVQREHRRKELEDVARELAQRYSVPIDSLQFIDVVRRELRRNREEAFSWNSGEVRMEEWAAHMYNGTRDAYWDDLNYENGRYQSRRDQLFGILEWLSQECPLLWAKYRERKLRRKKKRSDS